MEKRKIVIHTLESDLQERVPNRETASSPLAATLREQSTDMIKVKQSDYSIFYFGLITLGFFAIIGILGYFLYLDFKESRVNIAVSTSQEVVKTIDIKTLWPESPISAATIQRENYIVIKAEDFDELYKYSLRNENTIRSFALKIFNSTSSNATTTRLEIENNTVTVFGNTENSPLFGFYFGRALVIARDTAAFKEALRDKDINKL